jgi:hypothetical protein
MSPKLTAGPLAALLALGLLGPAIADERRLDLFDPQGRRAGHVRIDDRSGRVDFYDAQSKRVGFGRVTPTGDLERFGLDGRRQETIQPGPWPVRR